MNRPALFGTKLPTEVRGLVLRLARIGHGRDFGECGYRDIAFLRRRKRRFVLCHNKMESSCSSEQSGCIGRPFRLGCVAIAILHIYKCSHRRLQRTRRGFPSASFV